MFGTYERRQGEKKKNIKFTHSWLREARSSLCITIEACKKFHLLPFKEQFYLPLDTAISYSTFVSLLCPPMYLSELPLLPRTWSKIPYPNALPFSPVRDEDL